MTIGDIFKKMFTKREPEIYTPQREYIDRRHDALQRQLSFYKKKAEIPRMEARIKQYEKEVYGNGIKEKDCHNILKAKNHFAGRYEYKWRRGRI